MLLPKADYSMDNAYFFPGLLALRGAPYLKQRPITPKTRAKLDPMHILMGWISNENNVVQRTGSHTLWLVFVSGGALSVILFWV